MFLFEIYSAGLLSFWRRNCLTTENSKFQKQSWNKFLPSLSVCYKVIHCELCSSISIEDNILIQSGKKVRQYLNCISILWVVWLWVVLLLLILFAVCNPCSIYPWVVVDPCPCSFYSHYSMPPFFASCKGHACFSTEACRLRRLCRSVAAWMGGLGFSLWKKPYSLSFWKREARPGKRSRGHLTRLLRREKSE